MAVIKNVIARQDCTLNTKVEQGIQFIAGEVRLVRFASENEFRAIIQLGVVAESQGPPPTVQRAVQPIDPALQQARIQTQAQVAPPVEKPKTVAPRQCPKCLTMMIVTNDTEGPGDVFFCPNCQHVESLVEKPKEPQSEALAAEVIEEAPVKEVEKTDEPTTQVEKATADLSPKLNGYQAPEIETKPEDDQDQNDESE